MRSLLFVFGPFLFCVLSTSVGRADAVGFDQGVDQGVASVLQPTLCRLLRSEATVIVPATKFVGTFKIISLCPFLGTEAWNFPLEVRVLEVSFFSAEGFSSKALRLKTGLSPPLQLNS